MSGRIRPVDEGAAEAGPGGTGGGGEAGAGVDGDALGVAQLEVEMGGAVLGIAGVPVPPEDLTGRDPVTRA